MHVLGRKLTEDEAVALIEQQERHLQSYSRGNAKLHADWLTMEQERNLARQQLEGAVKGRDEAWELLEGIADEVEAVLPSMAIVVRAYVNQRRGQ
jgi:hypothetical protein